MVLVSGADIVVGGRLVAKVPEVLAAADDLIAPLKAELESQQSQRKVVRTENAAQSQVITIMGDKDIPYQLLRKVMFSCARAGFTDVRFAVRQKVSDMSATAISFRQPVLAWSTAAEDEALYHKVQWRVLALCLAVALLGHFMSGARAFAR